MAVLGAVEQLWRFPVKSMQGELIASGVLDYDGLVGDRCFALRHGETGKLLTAKRYGELLEAAARTEVDGSVIITLPDASEHAASDPSVHEKLSTWLGIPCRLDRRRAGDAPEFEMSFNAENPDEDIFTWACPSGTFHDVAAAHLLSTASLRAMASHHPAGDWDVRRFRPTAVIGASSADGLVETEWVGSMLHLGDATLTVTMPTIRCPVPTRKQAGGIPRDVGVARALHDVADNNLGVYVSVERSGIVCIGDELSK